MKHIAIVGPGFKPVPDVEGGAVEHLATVLIEQNEIHGTCHFDVYTPASPLLDGKKYNYAKLRQVKNRQHFLPIRAAFSIVNRICRALHIKKSYNYISCFLPLYVKAGYDLILVENNISLFFALKRRFPNAKIVFHIHNDFDAVDTDWDKTGDRVRELGRQATMVWAASHYLKRRLEAAIGSGKVHVLENCIEKERFQLTERQEEGARAFRERHGIGSEDFVILFCGRLDKWKGALELLQAVERMPQSEGVKVVLAGGSWFGSREEAQYGRQVSQAVKRLDGKAICCGYISQGKIQEAYGSADLVAVPSQCVEAFGMAALEAISMGRPCVASACGGLLDILDESCARLIPLGDSYVEQLSLALDELRQDRELLSRLAYGAAQRAKRFSGREAYFERFQKLAERGLESG